MPSTSAREPSRGLRLAAQAEINSRLRDVPEEFPPQVTQPKTGHRSPTPAGASLNGVVQGCQIPGSTSRKRRFLRKVLGRLLPCSNVLRLKHARTGVLVAELTPRRCRVTGAAAAPALPPVGDRFGSRALRALWPQHACGHCRGQHSADCGTLCRRTGSAEAPDVRIYTSVCVWGLKSGVVRVT